MWQCDDPCKCQESESWEKNTMGFPIALKIHSVSKRNSTKRTKWKITPHNLKANRTI